MFVSDGVAGQGDAPLHTMTHHRQRAHRPPAGWTGARWHDGSVTDAPALARPDPRPPRAGRPGARPHRRRPRRRGVRRAARCSPAGPAAHVVAHLTLNAEGLAGVLHGAHLGQPQPMYASPEAPRRRHRRARRRRAGRAARALPRRDRPVRRGARGDARGRLGRPLRAHARRRHDFALANVPLMRLREVEIHHADLDAGYTAADWPAGVPRRPAGVDDEASPTPHRSSVRPTDLDRTWHYGDGRRRPRRHRYVGRAGLVAHRPRHRRGPHVRHRRRSRRWRHGETTTYTGEVSPGGDPDVRRPRLPDADQGRRRPGDVQQLLPPALRRDRRGRPHRRRRRARAAARADRRPLADLDRHDPPALGPPPRASPRSRPPTRARPSSPAHPTPTPSRSRPASRSSAASARATRSPSARATSTVIPVAGHTPGSICLLLDDRGGRAHPAPLHRRLALPRRRRRDVRRRRRLRPAARRGRDQDLRPAPRRDVVLPRPRQRRPARRRAPAPRGVARARLVSRPPDRVRGRLGA